MRICLVDIQWEGHHTPYVSLYGQALIEAGHEVVFVTDSRHKNLNQMPDDESFSILTARFPQDNSNGSGVLSSTYGQLIRLRQLRLIFSLISKSSVDIVHFLFFDRTQIPLYLASQLDITINLPTLGTLHRDMFTGDFNTGKQNALQEITGAAVNQVLASGALTKLIVHSEGMRERITQSVTSASSANVVVLPAPTPKPVQVSTENARKELNLPQEDVPVLLFFGGMREEKGPDLLANALKSLDREVTVVYAGSPRDFSADDFKKWKREAAEDVSLIGRLDFIPEEEVDLYIIAADVLILPYRRQRGISGPLRRAAMIGTPVIGPEMTDVGDIIDRNNLGETFKYGCASSLESILASLDFEDPQIDAEDFASHRHWRVAGEELAEVYQSCLN